MVNIIVQLSKYLMILMITVYTYLCFSIFGYYDPDKKKRCLRKQNVLMFVMHLTAFLVMYLEKKDTKILALYLMQVTLLGGTILLYSFIYPKVSRLVVNNMCMLLSIGFIMMGLKGIVIGNIVLLIVWIFHMAYFTVGVKTV